MARLFTDNSQLARSKRVSKKPEIEQLEDRYVLDAWSLSLDFGKPNSPVDQAFKQFGTALQKSGDAYGWAKTQGLVAYDTGVGPALTRDGIKGKDNSFVINVPNGKYEVTATMGDPLSLFDKVSLFANGVRVLNKATNYQDRIAQVTFQANVSNGKLRLTFQDEGGLNPYFSLSGLEVRQILPETKNTLSVSIGSNVSVNEGTAQLFNAKVTGGVAPYAFSWDFGDGSQATGSQSLSHTYADNGLYNVSLTVTDSANNKATTKVAVTVNNVAPSVLITGASDAAIGINVNYQSTINDPGSADRLAGMRYSWDFGDGTASTIANPVHSFNKAGTYLVKLTVTDKDGGSRLATFTTKVTAPSTFVVSAGTNITSNEGDEVTFSGKVTGGVGPFSYSWDFGDGSRLTGTLTPKHTFEDNGVYKVTLTVADAANKTSSSVIDVTVKNLAPTVVITGASEATIGGKVNYQSTVNDPGKVDRATGMQYLWNFGDGTTSSSANPEHTFQTAGTYLVRLTVTDKDGGSSQTTTTTRVSGNAFVVSAGSNTSSNEGMAVAFSGQVTGGTAPFSYRWDFGDGSQVTGTLTPTHTFQDNGTYNVTLTVTDGTNTVRSSVISTNVSNRVPAATISGAAQTVVGANATYQSSVTDPSPVDQQAGFTYRWTFGDGTSSTAANPTHAFAATGAYTVNLTVTDKDGGASQATFTTNVTSNGQGSTLVVTPDVIQSPYLRMPNFGGHPTLVAVQTGNWSNPATWGGRLPQQGDIVSIGSGLTVTYDVSSTTMLDVVAVQTGGKLLFRTDISTKLRVSTLLIMEGGELTVGTVANPVAANVTAQILFPDIPIDTSIDPEQFGHGLVAFGKVTMHGTVRTETFIRLAQAPLAGSTTLLLSNPATGWSVGDKIALPDTHQLDYWESAAVYQNYVAQWETPTITGISADGRTITLSTPLAFNHLGNAEFLPQVAAISRNVLVKSENSLGTRGYALFTQRAEVDVRYVQFAGLGRTTKEVFDNTVFNNQGQVTHVGGNQQGRYPVNFFHLMGPTQSPSSYQYRFEGNTVICLMNPFIFRWGIDINDSHYGLISKNVVYNWAGSGISVEGGNETGNVFEKNFVSRIFGTGSRNNDGLDGIGYWFRGPDNIIRDNVASNIRGAGQYSYGFSVTPYFLGTVAIPAFPGADLSQPGQIIQKNMNAIPLPEFARNEVYGATYNGLTLWWLGSNESTPLGTAGTVKDFHVWNTNGWGYFGYATNGLTIDGWVQRGDTTTISPDNYAQLGLYFSDYFTGNLTVTNFDIRGVSRGIDMPVSTVGTTTISNGYLKNQININIGTPWSVGGGEFIQPRRTVINNVRFDLLTGNNYIVPANIAMVYSAAGGTNVIQSDSVFVYNYNGTQGDNFRVYYNEQRADFIVPQTGSNLIAQPGARAVIGSPVAGLSNLENWNIYGIAIAGEVAPLSAASRLNIVGLTSPIA